MKLSSIAIAAAIILPATASAGVSRKSAPNDVILHAWSWSFNTIADNMKKIADAGYDYVQTSPAQACYVGEEGGLALFSKPGDPVKGKWYYYYQPTDWTIGNYLLGSRDDFKAMADSAMKYNVRIIVDVLPNHTAIEHNAVLHALDHAVGGHENLFHANGFKDITQWDDREECTTGKMGGLPDVNTENPDFQYYYLQYVNDLINLGARGFRYDTAKHIGLPSDPVDPKADKNNFWPVATGREGVKGLSLLMPDSLFIYGEVLQGRNVKELEYSQYIGQTASNLGHALRQVLEKRNFNATDIISYHHPASPSTLVTWVESHDTYCNQHESADLTDDQIRLGWVYLTSRAGGTPLFFSRPAGSTRDNYWGDNRVGPRGNDEFFHPEVIAANTFRHKMAGQPEAISTNGKGTVIQISRGTRGTALINLSTKATEIKMATAIPDGNYIDPVHNTHFTVADGTITAKLAPQTTYTLYSR